MSKPFSANGRTAIVTGAASGIGYATVVEMARRGYNVLGADMNSVIVQKMEELGQHGFHGDLTSTDVRKAMVEATEGYFGEPASVIVCSAGITRDGLPLRRDKADPSKIHIFDEAKWDAVLNVNLKVPVYCVWEMLARRMALDLKGAKVILLGSICARGNRGQPNYCASKGGLVSFAMSLNDEFGDFAQSVVIHPGFTETPMVDNVRTKAAKALEDAVARTVSGKIHSVESVALAILKAIEEPSDVEVHLDHFKHAVKSVA